MTRMGLRNFTCLVPSEPLDSSHEWRDSEEEMEGAAGTSYEVSSSSYADHRKFKSSSSDHSDRINCSSGSTNVFACFRAGAINLVSQFANLHFQEIRSDCRSNISHTPMPAM